MKEGQEEVLLSPGSLGHFLVAESLSHAKEHLPMRLKYPDRPPCLSQSHLLVSGSSSPAFYEGEMELSLPARGAYHNVGYFYVLQISHLSLAVPELPLIFISNPLQPPASLV